MKTHEFIKALRNSTDKELIVANADGQSIHAGYHLTEIKAASFETVDCGGKTNRWNETILQLWVPEDAEDTYMKSDKFLRIYDKVRRLVPVDEQAAIRFFLEPPATTCKARDRALTGKAESCCA